MLRILIAEDSATIALLLKSILEKNADMQIVGVARDGREAVKMSYELKPDLITMDIQMPVMDGFRATRMIMGTKPVPIVVVSSTVNDTELRTSFRAIEEGALAVIDKPPGTTDPKLDTYCEKITRTVRAMAEVKLIRRRQRRPGDILSSSNIFGPNIIPSDPTYEVIAIGLSTGGPQCLAAVLGSMPPRYRLPILVVQHISAGFIGGMARWMQGNTLLDVKVAGDHQTLQPSTVYFAPDDQHLTMARNASGLITRLSQDPPINSFRPSATALLESAARVCGNKAVGVLLSGMGDDGVAGLMSIHNAKGHTFVQDEETSVVHGMPGAAIAMGAANKVIHQDKITAHLVELARM
jgi:two-component system, chemotaxis family, protein-glutamate methylesterase/glutaminase